DMLKADGGEKPRIEALAGGGAAIAAAQCQRPVDVEKRIGRLGYCRRLGIKPGQHALVILGQRRGRKTGGLERHRPASCQKMPPGLGQVVLRKSFGKCGATRAPNPRPILSAYG